MNKPIHLFSGAFLVLFLGVFIPFSYAHAAAPIISGTLANTADLLNQTFNSSSGSPVTVEITFDQPLANTPTVSVAPDGGAQVVTDCSDDTQDVWCFDYTIPNNVDLTTETVTVSGAQNATNETMMPDSSVNFSVDTKRPTITGVHTGVSGAGLDTVTLVFSEDVLGSALNGAGWSVTGTDAGGRTVIANSDPANSNSLFLTLSSPFASEDPDATITYTAGGRNLTNSAGNEMATAASPNITDGIRPTVALTYSANPTKAGVMTATATYSEAVASTPNISIDQPGTTDISNAAMTPGAAGVYTYDYTVNTSTGGTYVDGTATVSLSSVADVAGNSANTPTGTTFTIDTTPPTGTLSINSGAAYTNATNVTLAISATDALSTVAEMNIYNGSSFNAANWEPYMTTKSWQIPSGNSSHDVNIRFRDSLGNENAAYAAQASIALDTVAPVISEVTSVTTPTNDATPDYTFSSTEAGTVAYGGDCSSTSGGPVGSGATTVTFATLVDGVHNNCTVTVTDAAGNASNVLSVPSFTIDTTPPTVTVSTSIASGKLKAGATATITAVFSEPIQDLPAPTVTLSGAASAGPIAMVKADSTHYTYSYIAGAGDGVVTFTVAGAVDMVNNAQTVANTATLTLDNTAPIITVPADITEEATGANGAVVTYTATAADTLDGSVSVSCDHASGDIFPITTTVVTCDASDAAGNAAVPTSFTVTVHDTTGPTIAAQSTVYVEATSGAGATATYTSPTTSDIVDGAGVATCSPVSGTALPLGDTTITCNATDAAGNPATPNNFTLTVRDTTGPTITLNGATPDVEINTSYTESGATASDLVDGTFAATPSGSVDTTTVGDYTITYNASDTRSNAATPITRTVHVKDSVANALASISTVLAAPGSDIANNLNTVNTNNVHAFSGLYFEKSISGSPVGKLTFTGALDLSSSSTQAFLQDLGTKLDQSTGRIALDARTSAVFAATGASLEMYNIMTPVTATNLIVRDDTGAALTGVASGFNYDSVAHKVTFTAAHFTQFDIDTTPPVIAGHADVTTEATSAAGATVTYTAPDATDNIDATAAATCNLPSGTTFAEGDTTVTCSKTDTAGNAAIDTTFVVHVTPSTTHLFVTPTDNGDGTKSGTQAVATTTTTGTAAGGVDVEMPANLVITGPSGWDGSVALPVATTTYTLTADSGKEASAVEAIEIGAGDTHLEFDKAVKLLFAGQAGKYVGWSQAGVFHPITSTCDDPVTPTLAAGADCKVDVGSDLVVWTKHFSTFIAYTQTTLPTRGSHAGRMRSVVTPTPSSEGQVLGAATYHFMLNLSVGSRGAEVTALQQFLVGAGYSLPAGATGYFGSQTRAAVIAFQKARGIAQAGVVGPLTRAELNRGAVVTTSASSGLTTTQVNSIIAILQSFGVDQATVVQVRSVL